jgi:hypothetical protein
MKEKLETDWREFRLHYGDVDIRLRGETFIEVTWLQPTAGSESGTTVTVSDDSFDSIEAAIYTISSNSNRVLDVVRQVRSWWGAWTDMKVRLKASGSSNHLVNSRSRE